MNLRATPAIGLILVSKHQSQFPGVGWGNTWVVWEGGGSVVVAYTGRKDTLLL